MEINILESDNSTKTLIVIALASIHFNKIDVIEHDLTSLISASDNEDDICIFELGNEKGYFNNFSGKYRAIHFKQHYEIRNINYEKMFNINTSTYPMLNNIENVQDKIDIIKNIIINQ